VTFTVAPRVEVYAAATPAGPKAWWWLPPRPSCQRVDGCRPTGADQVGDYQYRGGRGQQGHGEAAAAEPHAQLLFRIILIRDVPGWTSTGPAVGHRTDIGGGCASGSGDRDGAAIEK
jgi:uncharacterized protein YndB with AHSA1/START domain